MTDNLKILLVILLILLTIGWFELTLFEGYYMKQHGVPVEACPYPISCWKHGWTIRFLEEKKIVPFHAKFK